MQIVLYQPDIAANLGAILRLCACMGVPCHVIEPCGFPFDDKRMKRSGMDYIEQVELVRHGSWEAFRSWQRDAWQRGDVIEADVSRATCRAPRLILLSTKATTPYTQFQFQKNDMLLLGRESAGVPNEVRDACDAAVTIPMQPPARSLNVAMAAAMCLGEALRQIGR